MALTWASLGTSYTSGTNPTLTFDFTPDAGEKIVLAICTRETTQTMTTPPSGYTLRESYTGGSNFNAWVYEKTSDGTETSVTFTLGASSNLRISAIVLQDPAGTLEYDDSDSDATNVVTATTSGGFGSVTTTEDDAGVAAILFMDQSWGGTDPTVTSYTNTNNDPVGSTHGGIDMFTRVLSAAGPETPTWSGSGDIDQNFGVLIAFKDVTGGGSIESGAGSSAGSATASAVGESTAAAAGDGDGEATAPGVGASTAAAAGSADGEATADGAGASIAAATGSSAGTSTAAGVGDTAESGIEAGAGSSLGSSTATGEGASTAAAAGSADGTSNAAGVGSTGGPSVESGAGAAAGSSSADAGGASTAAAAGSSAGAATSSGAGADGTVVQPADDPFWLYRDQDRALNEMSFPHRGPAADMIKLFQRFRRRA